MGGKGVLKVEKLSSLSGDGETGEILGEGGNVIFPASLYRSRFYIYITHT